MHFKHELGRWIDAMGSPTGYTLTQRIFAETDMDNTEFNRCKTFWDRKLRGESLNPFNEMNKYLSALGYELRIVKK